MGYKPPICKECGEPLDALGAPCDSDQCRSRKAQENKMRLAQEVEQNTEQSEGAYYEL